MSDSNQVQQEILTELRELKERVSDIETILSELKVMIEEFTAGTRDESLHRVVACWDSVSKHRAFGSFLLLKHADSRI